MKVLGFGTSRRAREEALEVAEILAALDVFPGATSAQLLTIGRLVYSQLAAAEPPK